MKRTVFWISVGMVGMLVGGSANRLGAQSPQVASAPALGWGTANGGNGDSVAPYLSADGTRVLFASLAGNLTATSVTAYAPPMPAAPAQVFLRVLTNATTILVSGNQSGTAGGAGDSFPVGLSADNRFALFESTAFDLVPGDTNNAGDIFRRDLQNGALLAASGNTNSVPGNGAATHAAMTPDGRFVAFASAATDLVAGDTNGITDVFVHDFTLGTTVLASVGAVSTNPPAPLGGSDFPVITPDGHFVVFSSWATNLVAAGTISGEVYLRDLWGATTTAVSAGGRTLAATLGGGTVANCYGAALSTNGQFVAYVLCPAVTNGLTSAWVFRYDAIAGTTVLVSSNAVGIPQDYGEARALDMTPDGGTIAFVANGPGAPGTAAAIALWQAGPGAVTLVSTNRNGMVAAGAQANAPVLDPGGRFLYYLANGTNLAPAPAIAGFHLYQWDNLNGSNQLVDADQNGAGSGALSPATVFGVSTNAQGVVFEAPDGNWVAGDQNRCTDVFVRDLRAQTNALVSAAALGLQDPGANGASWLHASCLSSNGQYLVFMSEATNLTTTATNGARNVYLRDLLGGSNVLINVISNGTTSPNSGAANPAISANGRYVVFTTAATNLVAGTTTSDAGDVYVRDWVAGTTTLLSTNALRNSSGNGPSFSPTISQDGTWVLFISQARNITQGSLAGTNLLQFNLATGRISRLTSNEPLGAYAATPDGGLVAFYASLIGLSFWDSTQGIATRYTNGNGIYAYDLALSPGGTRMAYASGSQIHGVDLTTQSNYLVSSWSVSYNVANREGLRFSADGNYLVYASLGAQDPADTNGLSDVYLYSFLTHTNLLISHSWVKGGAGNARSDTPEISPNGRYVVYRSLATDLVPGVNNRGAANLYLYDTTTGSTTLLSLSHTGNTAANHWSINAFFSGDSQTLALSSWAGDLVPGTVNRQGQVFVFSLAPPGSVGPSVLAQITATTPPTLAWTTAPGHRYAVQFKNTLDDTAWQSLTGEVTVVGNQGQAKDAQPGANARFYRIVTY